MFNKSKKSKFFYSLDVEIFFYCILSRRGIFFTAYSVDVEYFLPHTQ